MVNRILPAWFTHLGRLTVNVRRGHNSDLYLQRPQTYAIVGREGTGGYHEIWELNNYKL